MQLVEVVAGRETAPEAVQRALRFVQQIGKLPVLVKDSPGFLVNRILLPYHHRGGAALRTAARARRTIDAAMLDFGMPMGPLRLIDEVGVGHRGRRRRDAERRFPARLSVPEILRRMIESRCAREEDGQGFYVHRKERRAGAESRTLHRVAHAATRRAQSASELERRMVLLMVNEAARCLEEADRRKPPATSISRWSWAPASRRSAAARCATPTHSARSVVDELTQLAEDGRPALHSLRAARRAWRARRKTIL